MSKGGSSTTNTTPTPWSGVQPYLKEMYGDVMSTYDQGMPDYYPGQTYVERNPLENAAQQQMVNYAYGGMQPLLEQTQASNMSMLNAPDVANNPYVSGMADVIQDRMNRNLIENQLPAVGHGAIGTGQYGGSRQGIAEGQAIGRTNEAMGDALAQLYGDAYGQGLEQQRAGMLTAPQTAQMGMAPAEILGNYGAYLRGEDEQALQEDMARYQYETGMPYENLNFLNSMLMGSPWGGATTTSGGGGSSLGGALSGAMMGYSAMPALGGMLAGGSSAMGPSALLAAGAANPLMWPLVIGGGLLGSGIF